MSNNKTFSYSKLVIASAIATAVNAIVLLIGINTGASMTVNTPAPTTVNIGMVIGATLLPLLAAGFVTQLLARRFGRFLKFARWAGLIVAFASIGSLVPAGADVGTLVWLGATHIFAGAAWFMGTKQK